MALLHARVIRPNLPIWRFHHWERNAEWVWPLTCIVTPEWLVLLPAVPYRCSYLVSQVMVGCTASARMNGNLSNTVTQRAPGTSLFLLLLFKCSATGSSGFSWKETSVCFCLQVVAHGVLRPWWGGVCVWGVCQQPFVTSKSCKML